VVAIRPLSGRSVDVPHFAALAELVQTFAVPAERTAMYAFRGAWLELVSYRRGGTLSQVGRDASTDEHTNTASTRAR
jgi:hypothetical protein